VEAVLDRNGGVIAPPTRSPRNDRVRQEITLADRCLDTTIDTPDPTKWAELEQQAAALRDEVYHNVRVQAAMNHRISQTQEAQRYPRIENVTAPRGPELSL
jgi:hypothetical protein